MSILLEFLDSITVKPVLIGHSKIGKTKILILMTSCTLMKVESIAGFLFEWPLKTGFTVVFYSLF